jgi:hypothetical protein
MHIEVQSNEPSPRVITAKAARGSVELAALEKQGFRHRLRLIDDGYVHLWRPTEATALAVHQPNYLPWHGYFGKMSRSEVFVFLDDVQMPIGRSYVSRTMVRLQDAEQWLTVPVKKKNGASIREIEVAGPDWFGKHIAVLRDRYGKWPNFGAVMALIEGLVAESSPYLWDVNSRLIMGIAEYLGFDPVFELSSTFRVETMSDDRIIDIMKGAGVRHYMSGSGGMNYQSVEKFGANGMDLTIAKFASAIEGDRPRAKLTVLESLLCMSPEDAGAYIRNSVQLSRP